MDLILIDVGESSFSIKRNIFKFVIIKVTSSLIELKVKSNIKLNKNKLKIKN